MDKTCAYCYFFNRPPDCSCPWGICRHTGSEYYSQWMHEDADACDCAMYVNWNKKEVDASTD